MEKPYRRYALLSEHDGSKYQGSNSLLTYGVVTLDMSQVGKMPSCDFSRFVMFGLKENTREAKDNLEALLMYAHNYLINMLGDIDIDFGEVLLIDVPVATPRSYVNETMVAKFYSGMLEELKK
ncbi:MAG: hypothetical protein V1906_02705 [Candidatus Woesearchaeota archaeon]